MWPHGVGSCGRRVGVISIEYTAYPSTYTDWLIVCVYRPYIRMVARVISVQMHSDSSSCITSYACLNSAAAACASSAVAQ